MEGQNKENESTSEYEKLIFEIENVLSQLLDFENNQTIMQVSNAFETYSKKTANKRQINNLLNIEKEVNISNEKINEINSLKSQITNIFKSIAEMDSI